MKSRLFLRLLAVMLFLIPTLNYAQAPVLGKTADFVLFSSDGAVSNTGISILTGEVGTQNGAVTNFGNVNGVMHTTPDGATAQAVADLLSLYNNLNTRVVTANPAALLGNGQVLNPGVYSIAGDATLNLDLTLNAQGNPNAIFIFKLQSTFSTNANSEIKLINGAQACNVFWKVEGLVDMASNTIMKGTVIANNAAIQMSSGCKLEGRALSTTGAISLNGLQAAIPIIYGNPLLTGPTAPALGSVQCFTLFSSTNSVTNSGVTTIVGDVGTNGAGHSASGFTSNNITGTLHTSPDATTVQAASDLSNVYTNLNTSPTDIELLYPAQFGNNLVLTPHTYLLNTATVLTGNVYLNAQNNPNAVFIIKITGALSTATYAKVILMNGAQAKNVFWKVDGAVNINDYSEFSGTIVTNSGAVDLRTGMILNGRVFTTSGVFTTNAINATNSACTITKIQASQCGTTLPTFDTAIVADKVTGAQGYRFELSLNSNVLGTIDRTDSYFRLSQIAGTTYNKTYSVRVALLFNGTYAGYGTACNITTPTTAALTKIQASQCGTTLAALNTPIIADAISGVQGYKFEVSLNNVVIGTVQTTPRSFNLSQFTGTTYGKTYSIKAATLVNGTYGAYGTACTVTTPTTKIQTSQCGTTLPTFDTAIVADEVTGIQEYRFELSLNNNVLGTIDRTDRYFRLSQIAGTTYNKTYSVRVALLYNGSYSGYGVACNITTPVTPMPTKVQASQCGATLSTLDTPIIADAISGVQGYKFEVSLNNVVIGAVQTTPRSFNLSQVTGATYGKTYSIRVATFVNGNYGAYGSACMVTTTPTPTTKIQASQCGTTLPTFDTAIVADEIAGIQGYRFELSLNNNVLGTIDRTDRYFRLSQIAGTTYNKIYSVRVALLFNGTYAGYGAACNITTPTTAALTKIQASQCGTTLAALNTPIIADAISGVQGYKFEVSLNNVVIGTVQTTPRSFNLSQVSGTTYGKTYSIKVATLVNGSYGAYGSACTVTSPTSPSGLIKTTEKPEAATFVPTSLKVYPNPFMSTFKLDYSPVTLENVVIRVYDMTGKQIESRIFEATTANDQEFGTQYAAGIYNVNITQGNNIQNIRVIKN